MRQVAAAAQEEGSTMSARQQQLSEETTKARTPMPVIIRDTPPGYDWGWYSREDARMHLQTVDEQHRNEYKVWLENRGRRTCEPAAKIPSKVVKAIQTAVARKRQTIEDRWVSLMIRKGWLRAHLDAPEVTLLAYPNTPNSFTRSVNLGEDLTPEEIRALKPEDIRLSPEMASLEIWPSRPEDKRQDIRLSPILWQD
jgi:hypothetical protein